MVALTETFLQEAETSLTSAIAALEKYHYRCVGASDSKRENTVTEMSRQLHIMLWAIKGMANEPLIATFNDVGSRYSIRIDISEPPYGESEEDDDPIDTGMWSRY